MDNVDIEKFSVNAVENSMSGCLHPVLQKNSTLPSWDGEIYIYNCNSKKKENLIGRVSVQVKGTANNDFSKFEITRPVLRADLENYYNDGGALYFVIYVGEDGETKIYYNALTPDILHQILRETPKQQTNKNLIFKAFPKKIEDKVSLLKKVNSECEDLLPALEKAQESARLVRGIDNLKKKAEFRYNHRKLRNVRKAYKAINKNQDIVISSKEEFDVYYKLPKIWRGFGQIYGVARWSLIGFFI